MKAFHILLLVAFSFGFLGCRSERDDFDSNDSLGEEFGANDALSKERVRSLERRLERWEAEWGVQSRDAITALKKSLASNEAEASQWDSARSLYESTVTTLSKSYEEVMNAHPELREPLEAMKKYSEESEEYQAAKRIVGDKLPQLLGPAWEREMQRLKLEMQKLGFDPSKE